MTAPRRSCFLFFGMLDESLLEELREERVELFLSDNEGIDLILLFFQLSSEGLYFTTFQELCCSQLSHAKLFFAERLDLLLESCEGCENYICADIFCDR